MAHDSSVCRQHQHTAPCACYYVRSLSAEAAKTVVHALHRTSTTVTVLRTALLASYTPFTRCSRLFNQLYNRFIDKRFYRVNMVLLSGIFTGVQNAAAGLVTSTRKHDHITPAATLCHPQKTFTSLIDCAFTAAGQRVWNVQSSWSYPSAWLDIRTVLPVAEYAFYRDSSA